MNKMNAYEYCKKLRLKHKLTTMKLEALLSAHRITDEQYKELMDKVIPHPDTENQND